MGIACVAIAGPARAATSPAVQVVERLDAALLDALQNATTLGYQGRFDRLAPVVGEVFDVDLMAEKSLGRHWKTLSPEDQTRWKALFREFTIANYAGNLTKFSGQRFELLGEEPGANDTVVVSTKLIDPTGENVELKYRVYQTDGRWHIIDVMLKGTVSELALRRSDYSSVFERDGFDGLVTVMRGKIADLAAGPAKRQGS